MHKAAFHAKGFHRGAPCPFGVLRQILHDIEFAVIALVDHIHDGAGGYVARFKKNIPLGINNGIIGADLTIDKLLHDIDNPFVTLLIERRKLLVIRNLEIMGGTHAVIRLCHNGIAGLGNKAAAALHAFHKGIARDCKPCLSVCFLHFGFIFHPRHILHLKACGDIEIRPQLSILLQPVFVIAFQPVNPPVFEGKKGNRTIDLIIIFQTANLVIFVQAVFHILIQLLIRFIANAQYAHAVFLQLFTEFPIICWEIRGKKYKIFHRTSLLLSFVRIAPYSNSVFIKNGICFSQLASQCVPRGTMRLLSRTRFSISNALTSAKRLRLCG